MPHTYGVGAIFGIVSEGGVAKAGGRVGLYDRTTLQLVRQTVADSLGGYQFTGLNQTTSDYLVLALDDNGSPAKNALVQDYVQPISAHMGAVAYSNWWMLAMAKNPRSIWVPYFGWPTIPSAGPCYGSDWSVIGNTVLIDTASITPGAPNMPTVTLNNGNVQVAGRSRAASNGYPTPTNYSLEWVMDSSVSGSCATLRINDAGVHPGVCMRWNRSTKIMSQMVGGDWLGYNTDYRNLNAAGWYNDNGGPYTYSNSGLSDGPHHWVLTVEMSVSIKLYLDGTLVTTNSLVGKQNTHLSGNGCFVNIADYNGGSAGLIKSGPVCVYPVILTAGEVTASYNALMVGSSPLASGYVRELATDFPTYLFRLNAGTYGTEPEFFAGEALTHYGTITVQQTSPVVGGVMTAFGGGVAYGLGPGGAIGRSQNTWEFWINPDTAAPSATRYIAAARRSDNATNHWYIIQNITTGKLSILIRNSTNADEVANFNYSPPASTDTLIAITVDKVNGAAKIYANGVLQDTQTVLVGYFYTPAGDAGADGANYANRLFMIGGLRTSAGSISSPFLGKLSEFVFYPRLLGVDRLLAHYDARVLI